MWSSEGRLATEPLRAREHAELSGDEPQLPRRVGAPARADEIARGPIARDRVRPGQAYVSQTLVDHGVQLGIRELERGSKVPLRFREGLERGHYDLDLLVPSACSFAPRAGVGIGRMTDFCAKHRPTSSTSSARSARAGAGR